MSASPAVDWAALAAWSAATAGLELDRAQLDRLAAYLDTLLLWNRKVALVGQRDAAAIVDKHFADSLFVAGQCADSESVIDLGSGAGFPGLPIAIARPSSRVCVVEARGKKASFLEEVCRTASIRNAVVCNARSEGLAGDPAHRGRYTAATARALSSTDEFLSMARPFLASGGRAIAMRSVGEPRASEPVGAREVLYELPDGTPRRLLIY